MQRVSAFLPSWDKRSSGASKASSSSNTGGGNFFGWTNRNSGSSSSASRIPSQINVVAANASRVQREAFWPAPLDIECDKAARILKSFCTDGYLAPAETENATTAKHSPTRTSTDASLPLPSPAKVAKKIPKRIIQNAAGIAVFTCMRSGLWMTGSGGSGVLIARKSDGTWSPPSGILLHTPTLSFIIGIDVYDCVLIVNNVAALESITRPRVTLGEDVHLTNGPSVPLDSNEAHVDWKRFGDSVLAYMKARGQHQAVNLNGCLLAERTNENERFYDGPVTQMDILAGNVSRHVDETLPLFEVIKMAEGRTDFDAAVVSKTDAKPAPGDAIIATPLSTPASPLPSFGLPTADDPDPYGVLALEMAGLEIREAGSRLRPTSSQFDLSSAPLSPSLFRFNRHSVETFATRSNRASVLSSRTVRSQATDMYTHTDANTPETTPSPGPSDDGLSTPQIERILEVREDDDGYSSVSSNSKSLRPPDQPVTDDSGTSQVQSHVSTVGDPEEKTRTAHEEADDDNDDDDADADDNDDDEEEEPVVYEVAAVQPASTRAIASRVIHARGNVVTIPKRMPPPLPKRSPARTSQASRSDDGSEKTNVASMLRQAVRDEGLRPQEGTSSALHDIDGDEAIQDQPGTPHEDESKAENTGSQDDNPPENQLTISERRGKGGPPELDTIGDSNDVAETRTVRHATEDATKVKNEEQGEHRDAAEDHQKLASSVRTGATGDPGDCTESSPTEASKTEASTSGLMQDVGAGRRKMSSHKI